jgi:hypothetical protein
VDRVSGCGTIVDVPRLRLLFALVIVLGLCAPATAQVWKLKKAKTGTTAKTPAKKTKAKSTTSIKKKKKRSATKSTRKVNLVPDESAETDTDAPTERERVPDEADEPIFIQVEEI